MIPAFKSRIIDMHAHVGNWDNKSFDTNSFDVFLNSKFNKNDSIEKVIVSNLDCINPSIMQDEFVGNSDLLALIKNNPKFFTTDFKENHNGLDVEEKQEYMDSLNKCLENVNKIQKVVTVYAVVDQRQDYLNIVRGL